MTPYHFFHERELNLKNSANLVQKSQRRSSHDSVRKSGKGGFTLVELIVSVGLFAIVMLISVGALLALTGANRKAQALQSVMNNLNIALDGMVRSIRMGSNFHCGSGVFNGTNNLDDCPNGNTVLVFKPFGGNLNQRGYLFDTGGTYCGQNRICKSADGGAHYVALTSPEVTIDSMKFYVQGSTPGDTEQPKVVITVEGTAGAANMKTKTTFSIQATAVQRLLDL
ncbi:MAG: type II secretion system protein [bacterium]|nr:type II secretion system protein [bacterium]